MPELSEIHEALKKPTLFDQLRARAGTEADQITERGKGYVAKKAYDTLPHDVQTALPKPLQDKLAHVAWPAFLSMLDGMNKRAGIIGQTVGRAAGLVKANPLAATEVAGLGVLAAPGLDTMQAHVRARMAGDKTPEGAEKRQFMGEAGHAAADVGGLGILMHPELKHLLAKPLAKIGSAFSNSAYAGNVAQNPPGSRSHSPLAPFTAPALAKKEAGVGVGAGMSTSQYSGRLSDGAFKLTSPAPAFTSPAMASKKEASFLVRHFEEALMAALAKEAAPGMNTATDAMHAQGRLHATQSVGAPKTTAPAGPSIAQIAKPQGFGSPIAGAKKNAL